MAYPLTEQVTAVTLSKPLDVSRRTPMRRKAAGEPYRWQCPLPGCSWSTPDLAKWWTHFGAEMRDAEVTEMQQLASRVVEHPSGPGSRRSPGKGTVWRHTMKDGTIRYSIGHASFGTRRRGPDGQWWYTRSQALNALGRALAEGWFAVPLLPPPGKRQARREALGLSKNAAARMVGVCPKSIRDWEAGVTPTGDRAVRYARVLAGEAERAAR